MTKRFAATCWIACARLASGWAQAQTPAAPAGSEFEVASVKQLDRSLQPGEYDLSFVGTSGKPFKISGNRVTVNGTLLALIEDAYHIKDYQISATPAWAGTLLYTITAKAPGYRRGPGRCRAHSGRGPADAPGSAGRPVSIEVSP